MTVLSRAQVREVDRRAAEDLGLPTLALMENAGAGIARSVLAWLASRAIPAPAVVVCVCGKGANGGDGLVVARHLALAGHSPRIAFAADRARVDRKTDAGVNLTVCERLGLPLEEARDGAALRALLQKWSDGVLVVDALYGTGLEGELREPGRGLVEAVSACGRPICAVDVPSGLDCDTGQPLGVAVRATWTVTLAALKTGLVTPEARAFTGTVEVAGIGCPVA